MQCTAYHPNPNFIFLKDILKELKAIFQCSEPEEICISEPVTASVQEEKQVEVVTSLGNKRKKEDKEGEKAVPVKKIIGDGTRDPFQSYSWISRTTGIAIRFVHSRVRTCGP